jgi:hypothetical protein
MNELYLDERAFHHIRAVRTMLALARMRSIQHRGAEAAYYRAAGEHLERLRQFRNREEWTEILFYELDLSPSRAYELIALARGSTTLEALRFHKAASMKKVRKNKAKGA